MQKQRAEIVTGAGIAAAAFVVYAITGCRTVDVMDAGELTTVAYTLGIAHPSGYPLYSLIGWVATHIPIPARIIYKTTLLAGFCSAAALFFFFRLAVFTIKEYLPGDAGSGEHGDASQRGIAPALMATLVLGFSRTYWMQGTSAEVYSLQLLLVSICIYLVLRVLKLRPVSGRLDREWYLLAFVLGLTFSNHLTAALLAPAFIAGYLSVNGFRAGSIRAVGRLVPFLLLGLTPYLMLPIRGSEHPVMNWGSPVDWERLIWHISGKQYRALMFSSSETFRGHLQYFIDKVPVAFAWFPVAFALLGVWRLASDNRMLLVVTALLFISCVGYAAGYAIKDIDAYFLLAYITIALWAAIGAAWLVTSLRLRSSAVLAGAAVLGCIPLAVNYEPEDKSRYTVIEDYAADVVRDLPPNSILLSNQWSKVHSPMYYLQIVENRRSDVAVVDKTLLNCSWYYGQLDRRYPWLLGKSRQTISRFLEENDRQERGLPCDSLYLETLYAGVISKIIGTNIREHAVYVTPEIDQKYIRGLQPVPEGLAFRLYPDTVRHIPSCSLYGRTIVPGDSDGIEIVNTYARMSFVTAYYLNAVGERDSAIVMLNQALRFVPDLAPAIELKKRILGPGTGPANR